MKILFRILSITSRIPGILFCFMTLIFGTALVMGLIGREGPLSFGIYKVATNTPEGLLLSLIGMSASLFLAWLFMIQIPYLCIRRIPAGFVRGTIT